MQNNLGAYGKLREKKGDQVSPGDNTCFPGGGEELLIPPFLWEVPLGSLFLPPAVVGNLDISGGETISKEAAAVFVGSTTGKGFWQAMRKFGERNFKFQPWREFLVFSLHLQTSPPPSAAAS